VEKRGGGNWGKPTHAWGDSKPTILAGQGFLRKLGQEVWKGRALTERLEEGAANLMLRGVPKV
jgi:hypothetical protein